MIFPTSMGLTTQVCAPAALVQWVKYSNVPVPLINQA
ncbi:hypothetical protein BX589_107184 [Paraburkholderia fungorum]|jgi:hypothetical protein|nr:hypothetical protein [Paraburkholderia fungorum]PRZ54351.1 hypothetical protein BX589_107184 [Paraburkholderia fungorum]